MNPSGDEMPQRDPMLQQLPINTSRQPSNVPVNTRDYSITDKSHDGLASEATFNSDYDQSRTIKFNNIKDISSSIEKTSSGTQSPHNNMNDLSNPTKYQVKSDPTSEMSSKDVSGITSETALGSNVPDSDSNEQAKISAYARLDFDSYTFFVQTLQVILGRKSNDEILNGSQHSVDVHLSSKKAISRRHAKIFYNFGTQRFELSIMGRNGAFVDDLFIEKGATIPLIDGTKIQIGDIPFSFILPSLEPNQLKDTYVTNKPFNPSDAISLRSSLFSNSNSGSPNKHDNNKRKSINRRNSKVIPRKLSEARRKSLASATNDEITMILSELGVASIDDIDEEDPSYVDAQIKAILGDNHNTNESAIADDDDEEDNDNDNDNYNDNDNDQMDDDDDDDDNGELSALADFNEGEEDELDKLVKQHNLEQGVDLDEQALERDNKQIDMDIHAIDEEIGHLTPLINSQNNQELINEKEERKRQLEEEKRSKQELQRSRNNLDNNSSSNMAINFNQSNQNHPGGFQRTGPLMGKPATPRMGKPASIQPPASRLYGRSISNSNYNNNGSIMGSNGNVSGPMTANNQSAVYDNRFTATTHSSSSSLSPPPLTNSAVAATTATSIGGTAPHIAGLPTHLVAQGPGDYSLRIAQGTLGHPDNTRSYMSSRPPAPELLVPIETVKQVPQEIPETPIDKITVFTNYNYPPIHLCKILEKIPLVPKIPLRKKDSFSNKRPSKSGYIMSEIPEQYRTKPTLSFPVMIINILKSKNDYQGMSINEICEAIKETYPYYKYCPDGWQSVVIHNMKLNKLFKVINNDETTPNTMKSNVKTELYNDDKENNEEDKWIIDESFIQEKEKARKKQQEIASQKAKEAAIRAEELKQKQRLEMQQSISNNIVGRDFVSPYGSPMNSHGLSQPQYRKQASPGYSNVNLQLTTNNLGNSGVTTFNSMNDNNGQKPKTIAELASEIRRDGVGSKTHMYFKPQPNSGNGGVGTSLSPNPSISPSNIKAQLAANRSQYSASPSSNNSPTLGTSDSNVDPSGSTRSQPQQPQPQSPSMNQDTKKSLAYLQKELFNLYKARKLSYNTATTTEIITKALATTIAQVNVIGSKAGVKDNALSFLVERAPQQVSKILDIALTKSIKEKQGILTSRSNSRGTTPGASQISSPNRVNTDVKESTPLSSIVKEANRKFGRPESSGNSTSNPSPMSNKGNNNSGSPTTNLDSLGKPPLFSPAPGKPINDRPGPIKYDSPPLSRPLSGTPGIPKPQSYNKPPGLSKPPQFLSNKAKPDNKRTREDSSNEQDSPNKSSKT